MEVENIFYLHGLTYVEIKEKPGRLINEQIIRNSDE